MLMFNKLLEHHNQRRFLLLFGSVDDDENDNVLSSFARVMVISDAL